MVRVSAAWERTAGGWGRTRNEFITVQQTEELLIRARSSPAAAIAVVLVALLLASEVARLTVSFAVEDENPELAFQLAPFAPGALASTAMKNVGEAAAQGGRPSQATLERLHALAAADPLRTEPFLVQGALAERAGAYDQANELLGEARARDPRSTAARYLYADTALRQGKVVEALKELAVLSRLVPGTSVQLVPALAEFARAPGSRGKLAGVLAQNPQLKNPLLLALASDPDNADLIVSLAGPATAKPTLDTRAWQARLLLGLVARGDYQRAYDLWRGFARLPAGAPPLLFNGTFKDMGAPEPFNWALSASPAGVAEPGPEGLQVLYYGREDTVLATQLLVLPPGEYRFAAPMTGDMPAGALSWTLGCVGAKAPLMDLRLGGPELPAAKFTVPSSGCPAQRLMLNGHLEESPEDSDVRIGPAGIERIGG